MNPKKTRFFLIFIAAQIIVVLTMFVFPWQGQRKANYAHKRALLQKFNLSDYCLSTESRHTRHINFPELIAPFQDLAGFHDHFPSSSFFKPQRRRFRQQPRKKTSK